jgi:putative PIN family toxin of toxin-antitoxin system
LYEAFEAGGFIWVLSNDILTEYEELIGYVYTQRAAELVLDILLTAPNHERADPAFRWQLVERDPEDNKFVDLALSTNIDYLVSDDRHLLSLRTWKFPPVPVISFEEFRRILNR